VGAGLQPSVAAVGVNLVVSELAGLLVAGKFPEMEIVRELPSAAWRPPLAGVLGIHEEGLGQGQITLARAADRLPVAFSDTPY